MRVRMRPSRPAWHYSTAMYIWAGKSCVANAQHFMEGCAGHLVVLARVRVRARKRLPSCLRIVAKVAWFLVPMCFT